jgi:dUTP pyrophosphatase
MECTPVAVVQGEHGATEFPPEGVVWVAVASGCTPHAMPQRSTKGSAGLDVYASEHANIPKNAQMTIRTGVSIRKPKETYVQLKSRSSLSVSKRVHVVAGVCDPDFTGEVTVVLANYGM